MGALINRSGSNTPPKQLSSDVDPFSTIRLHSENSHLFQGVLVSIMVKSSIMEHTYINCEFDLLIFRVDKIYMPFVNQSLQGYSLQVFFGPESHPLYNSDCLVAFGNPPKMKSEETLQYAL